MNGFIEWMDGSAHSTGNMINLFELIINENLMNYYYFGKVFTRITQKEI